MATAQGEAVAVSMVEMVDSMVKTKKEQVLKIGDFHGLYW